MAENDVKITKRTWVPISVMVAAIILACAITNWVSCTHEDMRSRLNLLESEGDTNKILLLAIQKDLEQLKIDVAIIRANIGSHLEFEARSEIGYETENWKGTLGLDHDARISGIPGGIEYHSGVPDSH